jgi:type VI secretion system protein ImpG
VFNKYFQDELAYLRDLGQEFARANPEGAHFIGEAGADPDVERLLEGFAFLTARIRQKLDDEIPEFAHSLVEMFWPHYLRPLPAFTVVQFEALPQAAKEVRNIPRGTELQSVPVDGTPCRFRTTAEVPLLPLSIEAVTLRTELPPRLSVRFRLPDGVPPSKLAPGPIRLHLAGDASVSRALHLCLNRYAGRISAQAGAGAPVVLSGAAFRPGGFDESELVLPYPAGAFPGFRHLQEYFAYPTKYMFVDLTGVEGLAVLGAVSAFDIHVDLTRLPEKMPPVVAANLLLHCAPALNLFPHDADPVRLDHTRTEYKVRPAGENATHYEIYSIEKVAGVARGTGRAREYLPFFRFARSRGSDALYYRHRLEPAVATDGTELFLEPLPPQGGAPAPDIEVLSLELTCSNRQLPSKLRVGDVSVPTSSTPPFVRFRNLTRPTVSVPPPLSGDVLHRLLSHLSLNYLTLTDLDSFRSLLLLYHFRARVDRQAENALRLMLEGVRGISSRPSTRMLRGHPIRGVAVDLEVDEDQLGGEGEAWLLGCVLDEFFSQYVSLNAFSRLSLKGLKYGEVHTWPPRTGDRILV